MITRRGNWHRMDLRCTNQQFSFRLKMFGVEKRHDSSLRVRYTRLLFNFFKNIIESFSNNYDRPDFVSLLDLLHEHRSRTFDDLKDNSTRNEREQCTTRMLQLPVNLI